MMSAADESSAVRVEERTPTILIVKDMFRPTFCANCGEKIERAEWGIFTSRRFCQVCESEFKGQDLIPRFIVGVGVLIGVLGFGGYLKSGSAPSDAQLVRQPKKFVEQSMSVPQGIPKEPAASAAGPSNSNLAVSASSQNQIPTVSQNVDPPLSAAQKLPKLKAEPVEALYFCGARTAKGTPCKHRVKGSVRCFQHVGMEALIPQDQLRIK